MHRSEDDRFEPKMKTQGEKYVHYLTDHSLHDINDSLMPNLMP